MGRGGAVLAAAVLAVGGLGLGVFGCAGGSEDGFRVPPAPAAGELLPKGSTAQFLHGIGARALGAEDWQRVEAGHEVRAALVTSPNGWTWTGRVPEGARLRFGVAATPEAWEHARRLTVRVIARWDGGHEVLEQATVEMPADPEPAGTPLAAQPAVATPEWQDVDLDLGRLAGRRISLELTARVDGLPPELRDRTVVAWSPVRLGPPAAERAATSPERPNVLLVVIDTLRADHLPTYGYGRDTAPEIDRLLAQRGVVFEHASAQAPWTLPSVLSYLTGRHPGELLSSDMAEYGIPEGVPSLAERFRRLGYRTGGFYANPTLHAGNGFARGFETFYSPAPTTRSLRLHGDTITSRAVPWLLQHAGEPFFAYLHYVDPHDPYQSPRTEEGAEALFDPGYAGRVNGDWAHGLYLGRLELDDPQRDLEHLVALYDEEVRYVDGQVAQVLESLPPEVLANTLVVLTSDHGEEFLDHGWWKHGQTVYQEQLHVPLIVRWDGRVPAGERVAVPVQLLDLVPTLMAAATGDASAGGESSDDGRPDPLEGRDEWDGFDLLPVLTGSASPPRRPAVAEHLAGGPRRAAARLGDWKLVLFDRAEPYEPPNQQLQALYDVALGRLQRIELYDLASDPAEQHDVAAEHPELVQRLAPLVIRQLDTAGRRLDGGRPLRIALGAVPEGSVLEGEIDLAAPPTGWASDFLAPGDRVELDGATLRFSMRGEGWPKGLLVLAGGPSEEPGNSGPPGEAAPAGAPGLRSVRLFLDGEPVPAERLAVGEGRPYSGGAVTASALETEAWPPAVTVAAGAAGTATGGRAPRLFLWIPAVAAPVAGGDDAVAEETARRLRALGYIQ